MEISWGKDKNDMLKERYGLGFETVVAALDEGKLLFNRQHPNRDRYPDQRQMVIEIDGYAWVVPYIETNEGIFLKTMFPSRRATHEFMGQ